MMQTLILPGLHDSDPEHWQSLWEAGAKNMHRVIQDNWVTPRCADWVSKLDQALADRGPDAVLVAHSTGCGLVVHWVADRQQRGVRGARLVAPSDPEASSFPPGPTGFAPIPVQRFPFRRVVVASSDDPFATVSRAQVFARAWGSEFVMIGKAGYINSESALGNWPQGLAFLRSLCGSDN